MRRPFSRKQSHAAEVEAPAAPPGVGGLGGGGPEKHTRAEDPDCESSRVVVAESARGPRRSVSEDLLGGQLQHPLQLGYDPRTYPDDPRLVGKANKPQPPVSVPMDCKAEWERIRAEDPWPDDLGYTV